MLGLFDALLQVPEVASLRSLVRAMYGRCIPSRNSERPLMLQPGSLGCNPGALDANTTMMYYNVTLVLYSEEGEHKYQE